MIIELKIELLGVTKPKVWRLIKVSPDIKFHKLHLMIQAAFGWHDSHLYQFSENGFDSLITICSPYQDDGGLKATEIPIGPIVLNMHNSLLFDRKLAQKLIYIYDYGDYWEHEITAISFDDSKSKTQLIKGSGACPPEDCGGVHGYKDLKKSLLTGEPSEIHGEHWNDWLVGNGYEDFDPNIFDIEEAQRQLRQILE